MTRKDASAPRRAIGYVRVSTGRQGESGLGLDAQRRVIEQACEQRGWVLVRVVEEVRSGGAGKRRPGIAQAIDAVEQGEAAVLVAAKLDRLARGALDFATLLDRSERNGWELVIAELALDTTTPMGRFAAQIIAAVAELERAMIRSRTSDALGVAKERGTRLGRPERYRISEPVKARIAEMRRRRMSYRAIARTLAEDGVPTATGGRWHAETVRQAHLSTI